MEYRTEKDSLGEKNIPREAYWGIHTARAKENFDISGRHVPPPLIAALAHVKKAACLANQELGFIPVQKAEAIITACDCVYAGALHDQFQLDALQGGAGTSTNMNINEVIANRAIEALHGSRGDYSLVHPVETVNLHQSTNDVYPTALKIAAIGLLRELGDSIAALQGVFQAKEKEFAQVVTIGRTEMQDAVPMTVGTEFAAFAEAWARDRWRIVKCEERLRVVNIGGTAIGTGLAAPREYIFLVIEKLRQVTGLGLSRAECLTDGTANADVFVEVSGILKAHAANIIKISDDLRLKNMTQELTLPKLQAGSSIMPTKVNPVKAEAAIQGALVVIANDALITDAVSRGTLQINEFLPVVASALLESLDILRRINRMLYDYVAGITVNAAVCRRYAEQSLTLVTALLPAIGYAKAEELAQEFLRSGQNDLKAFLRLKLGDTLIEKALSPQYLTALGYRKEECGP